MKNMKPLKYLCRSSLGILMIAMVFIGCPLPSDGTGNDDRYDDRDDHKGTVPVSIMVHIDAPNLRLLDDQTDTVQITFRTTPALNTISELTDADTITIPLIVQAAAEIEKSEDAETFTPITDRIEVTISPNEPQKSITLRVIPDDDTENDQFTIEPDSLENGGRLNDTNSYTVSIAAAQKPAANILTIEVIDNDIPSVDARLLSPSLEEGGTGTLVLTLNNPLPHDVLVTATVDSDTPLILDRFKQKIIALNKDIITFSIPIASTDDDRVNEADQTYTITFSTTSPDVNIIHPTLTLNVIDNDIPLLSIAPANTTITEGEQAVFTITASIAPYRNIDISYRVSGTEGAGPEDYIDHGSGTATIAAQDTTATITIAAIDDTAIDADEELILTLETITPDGGAQFDSVPNSITIAIIDDESFDTDGDTIIDGLDSCKTGIGSDEGWSSTPETDADRDGCRDLDEDVDDDNDGLIEIYTLAQLDHVRYNLAGAGYRDSTTATAITHGAPLNPATCPEATDEIYLCGYELMNDLDFDTNRNGAAFTLQGSSTTITATPDTEDDYYNGGAGWVPIGHCDSAISFDECRSQFTGIFEGNGNTISNLYINHTQRGGTGLFGSATKIIRNVQLEDVYVENSTHDDENIGSLVGNARGARIQSSSAEGVVRGSTLNTNPLGGNVGGLIGSNFLGTISSSSFRGSVIGGNIVGGLAGTGTTILHSYSTGGPDDIIIAQKIIGGLAGRILYGPVMASYSTLDVRGEGDEGYAIGGLIGTHTGVTYNDIIAASYATGNVNTGDALRYGGGLAGYLDDSLLLANYATGNVVGGNSENTIGGLVGHVENSYVFANYATGNVTGGDQNDKAGGLAGGTHEYNYFVANYTTGNVSGGTGDDFVGGLIGYAQTPPVLTRASYTNGIVDGGEGDSDSVGTIAGSDRSALTFRLYNLPGLELPPRATYGFGSVRGGENTGYSPALPPGVTIPSDLTAATAGYCNLRATTTQLAVNESECSDANGTWVSWNNSLFSVNAWDFGTTAQPPALRIADYDSDDHFTNIIDCETAFPDTYADGTAIICGSGTVEGTLIPNQPGR